MLSVGVSTAVRDAPPNDAGIQEQAAIPLLDGTALHPEMALPPSRKATDPACETVAVMVMLTPIGVDETPSVTAREIVGVNCEIVMVNEDVVEVAPLLSVTVMVIADDPAVVAVPLIVPAEELRESPAGSVPLANENWLPPEPPLTESVSENAALNEPLRPEVGVVMTRVEETVKERVTTVADS